MKGVSFVKSNYSLLKSNLAIETTLATASDFNYEYLALADTEVMSGTLDLLFSSFKYNIKPIIGLEVFVKDKNFEGKVILYARNQKGYENLLKISTWIKAYEKKLTWEYLYMHSQGLSLVLHPHFSPIEKYIFEDNKQYIISFIDDIKEKFKYVYLGLAKTDNEILSNKIISVSKLTKSKVIVANATLYLDKNHFFIPELLRAIDDLREAKLDSQAYKHNYLHTKEEINNFYDKSIIDNTNEFFEKTYFEFKVIKSSLPDFAPSVSDHKQLLKDTALKGLASKFKNNIAPHYLQRLNYELKIICKLNFENYFLIVSDFVKFAHKNNILVGPGRGSAAGSLVSFALSITQVDPIKFGLLFERFLNENRVTMPDIDIDFEDLRRDEVIEYVVNKYGKEHVSYISTTQTIGAKMALRDVGRAIGISPTQIDILAKYVPNKASITLLQAMDMSLAFRKEATKSQQIKKLVKLSQLIEGTPRQTGTHAAGIVLSKNIMSSFSPLMKSKSNNLFQTQFNMKYLEELGLFKIDFLGIRNLTTIKNIVDSIKNDTGKTINIKSIPLDDVKTFEMLSKGMSEGIFQLESKGMKEVLKGIKPSSIGELSVTLSIYRPGPMDNIPTYIARKHGREKIEYIHQDLMPILKSTYGIIIYQEQIMQIANAFANFSYSKADILRRAMSKKDIKAMTSLEKDFIDGATKKGYNSKIAKDIYDLIYEFANYGFNSAHAISYSIIGYQLAYLKTHYPKHFLISLLTTNIGDAEKTQNYLYEAKKLGISVKIPSINISTMSFVYLNDNIYFPLIAIRNLGEQLVKIILKTRQEQPFASFEQAIIRLTKLGISTLALQSLIDAGAFDDFNHSRTAMRKVLTSLVKFAKIAPNDTNQIALFDKDVLPIPKVEKIKDNLNIAIEDEYNALGFYVSTHPITLFKKQLILKKGKINDISQIVKNNNVDVALAAILMRYRVIKTKTNKKMAFMLLEDDTSKIEGVIFPEEFEQIGHIPQNGELYGFVGRYNKKNNNFVIKRIKTRKDIENK